MKLNGTHYFVFNGKQKCYILLYITRLWVIRRRTVSWVSKPFSDKGPRLLLWAGSPGARGKITISGISIRLNYCVIFELCTQFTNMAAGPIIQPGGPRTILYFPNFSHLWLPNLPACGVPLWNINILFPIQGLYIDPSIVYWYYLHLVFPFMRKRCLSFSQKSRRRLGPTQPPSQVVPRASSSGGKSSEPWSWPLAFI